LDDSDFLLARCNPDGSLDPSFGIGGKVRTSLGDLNSAANDAVLQPDGKIVAVGWNPTQKEGGVEFALVRYLATSGGTPTANSPRLHRLQRQQQHLLRHRCNTYAQLEPDRNCKRNADAHTNSDGNCNRYGNTKANPNAENCRYTEAPAYAGPSSYLVSTLISRASVPVNLTILLLIPSCS
jgi:hypothetical protein